MDLRPEASEALGTALVVLAGGAAILGGLDPLAVALAFGLAVLALVHLLGPVGGAHFNPAVTFAFAATRHFPWRRVPGYLAAQAVGATAACLALLAATPDLGPVVVPTAALPPVLFGEAAGAALLGATIVAVAKDRRVPRAATGLAIGAAVTVAAAAFGPLGAGVNPARAFAPALVAGAWGGLWPHLAAPAFGAVAGMAGYMMVVREARP